MIIQLLFPILIGVTAGIFTGLIPGIHINLVSVLVVSSAPLLLQYFSFLDLAIFILSMAITHSFLDAIPSILLGAPESDTALGVLPGHQLLMKGMGYEAIKLTVIGSLLGLLAVVILFPLLVIGIGYAVAFLQPHLAVIMIIVVSYLIMSEKTTKHRLWAALVFFLAGIAGLVTLTSNTLHQPLFPLLSGLFGVSMLMVSLNDKVSIPKQDFSKRLELPKTEYVKALSSGAVAGSMVSFFPGLGPAQAAILGGNLFGKISNYAYLVLIGSINTVNMAASLAALFVLDKARNGAVIAVKEILPTISVSTIAYFLSVFLIVGGIATLLALTLSKFATQLLEKINYTVVCLVVIVFIVSLVFYFDRWLGLVILITATAIGIIPNVAGIKRSHAMGCLMLPVILFFTL